MNVLVFEDEALSAERLVEQLASIDQQIRVLAVLESVKEGVEWIKKNGDPELILMDIHLADGNAFELFKQVRVEAPVIFTTAFDEYAIKAFKVNSIDYLLKPIDKSELANALDKLRNIHKHEKSNILNSYADLFQQLQQPRYKTRFLVKFADQLKHIDTTDISYFRCENEIVTAVTFDKKTYYIDNTLEQIEKQVDPAIFFRINRQSIVSIKSIDNIRNHFNGRLKLYIKPAVETDIFVSRDRVADFKKWLDS